MNNRIFVVMENWPVKSDPLDSRESDRRFARPRSDLAGKRNIDSIIRDDSIWLVPLARGAPRTETEPELSGAATA